MSETTKMEHFSASKIPIFETYFFDTYAFFEILRGNPRYERYKNAAIVTTIFNLAELASGLKKEISEPLADEYVDKYWMFVVDITRDDVKKATNLKVKRKKMSIPDCIGYTVAQRLQIQFLTGDDDFKDLQNVEFVKK